MINIFLLILGMFVEGTAALILLTPIIFNERFAIHFMLHPALIKKLTKSFISGSIAQLLKMVVPLARLAE